MPRPFSWRVRGGMQALLSAEAGGALAGLHWILLTGESENAITLDELRSKGRAALKADPQAFERIHAEMRPEDPAILYLTSGATGEPKMGSPARRLASNIDMGPVVLPLTPDDCTIALLPSAHIAQRVVVELVPIRMGVRGVVLGRPVEAAAEIEASGQRSFWRRRAFGSECTPALPRRSASEALARTQCSIARRPGDGSGRLRTGRASRFRLDAARAQDCRSRGILENSRAARRETAHRRIGCRAAGTRDLARILLPPSACR